MTLLNDLNTFAGKVVFIALVAGELWGNFYPWAERVSAASSYHRERFLALRRLLH